MNRQLIHFGKFGRDNCTFAIHPWQTVIAIIAGVLFGMTLVANSYAQDAATRSARVTSEAPSANDYASIVENTNRDRS